MAAPVAPVRPEGSGTQARADIPERTLRQDRWWVSPAISATVLLAFVAYSTWAAFQNGNYYWKPYISPFYSPCIATECAKSGAPYVGIFGPWWAISPAILILIFPLGFRLTCYYYRRAYYRSIWLSPPPAPWWSHTGATPVRPASR